MVADLVGHGPQRGLGFSPEYNRNPAGVLSIAENGQTQFSTRSLGRLGWVRVGRPASGLLDRFGPSLGFGECSIDFE